MKWQVIILTICSLAHWTHQITSQQYGQLVNKQQLYGQFAGKQPLVAQYSNPQPLLGQYSNQSPLLAQYSSQNPLLAQYSNQQAMLAQYKNQQNLLAQHNQKKILAQYSSPQPLIAQYSNPQSSKQQMAYIGQLNKQQYLLQQQQMAAHQLRPRWAGPYKPYFPTTAQNGLPQAFRAQKPLIKTQNLFAQGFYKSPPKFYPTALKEGYGIPLPSSALASQVYPQYATSSQNVITGQQSSKQLSAAPYKFVSTPPQKKNVPVATPMKSFFNIPFLSQSTVSTTHGPFIQSSASPSIPSNYFEQSQSNYINDASQNYLTGHAVAQSNQFIAPSTSPPRTIVYPVRSESERGPIHTIPAPNLSLADKPIIVPNKTSFLNSHLSSYINNDNKVSYPYSYQVTEETKDKIYKNPYTGESKLYAPDPLSSQQTKPISSSNYFSTVSKQTYPQDTAFKVQSVTPSLSSHELYNLLNGGPSQQQLADTYNFPLLQQPQLQQHFMQQTIDASSQLQPFKAIVQPTYGEPTNAQQNVLFKPDPKYLEKIQEQFLKPYTGFQPNFQTFNYVEPSSTKGVSSLQTELLKANIDSIINQESNDNHFNYVRNTQEGSASENSITISKEKLKNTTAMGKDLGSFNMQTSVNFNPSNEQNHKGFAESSPLTASYFTQVSDPDSGSVSTNYYSPLTNNEVANILLAVQNANNLTSNEAQEKKTTAEFSPDLQSYFAQNSIPRNSQYTISDSGFAPINGYPNVKVEDSKAYDSESPLRIYIPKQYDDIETQPSQNIHMSASLNADQKNTELFRIYGDNDNQDYEEYAQMQKLELERNSNLTEPELHLATEKQRESNTDDVIVVVQKNETNPTLDILTKDWKTSIVIKPTEKNTSAVQNQVSEYGSRIRPKNEE